MRGGSAPNFAQPRPSRTRLQALEQPEVQRQRQLSIPTCHVAQAQASPVLFPPQAQLKGAQAREAPQSTPLSAGDSANPETTNDRKVDSDANIEPLKLWTSHIPHPLFQSFTVIHKGSFLIGFVAYLCRLYLDLSLMCPWPV